MRFAKIDKVLSGFSQFYQQFSENYQGIMIGCSAGLDSTVLVHLLQESVMNCAKLDLAICHMNYGLRGEASEKDVVFLQKLAQSLRIRLNLHEPKVRFSEKKPGLSLQSWARQERYDVFTEHQKQGWVIALGHHLDDHAENVLIRMARGTSPAGVSGMKVWREPYWRPLLGVPKSEIQAWANSHQVQYRTDDSNAKLVYTRNVIRHAVLPQLELQYPGAGARIVRLAQQAETLAQAVVDPLKETLADVNRHGVGVNFFVELGQPKALLALSQIVGSSRSTYVRKQVDHSFLQSVWDHLVDHQKTRRPRTIEIAADGGRFILADGVLTRRTSRKPRFWREKKQHRATLKYYELNGVVGHDSWVRLGVNSDPCGPQGVALWNTHRFHSYIKINWVSPNAKVYFESCGKAFLIGDILEKNALNDSHCSEIYVLLANNTDRAKSQLAAWGLLREGQFWQPSASGRLFLRKAELSCCTTNTSNSKVGDGYPVL